MDNNPQAGQSNVWLYLTVFITGASVMVIELLGTRLIAPFYGASLFVWSSLISVTMIALAAGYFFGGYWADRAQRSGLALIIALAAFSTLIIPWLTRPVLLATDSLGLRGGAFASSLTLFFPALMLLGMVGPFAIKLATSRLNGVGASSGTVYAVSTLGSVIGTLVLGFYLFPKIGSRQILISLSFVLFILAVAVAIWEQKKFGKKFAVLPCVLMALGALIILPKVVGAGQARSNSQFEILSEKESLYGYVRVIDETNKDLRFLTADASMIGAANISDGANRLTYQDIVGLLPALKPGIKKALLIGQGAGHMAMALREKYGITVDTLEIDPAVAEAASSHFGFKPTGRQVIGDARYEIRHLTGRYDLIIHDCFTGGTEPTHLLTIETIRQLKGLLAPQGILALNFVAFSQNEGRRVLASVSKTLLQVLPHQALFISEPGEDFNDFIFLASQEQVDVEASSLSAEQKEWLNQRKFSVESEQGIVLTDDFNPLEHMQVGKSEHYRDVLVSWFGNELLIR